MKIEINTPTKYQILAHQMQPGLVYQSELSSGFILATEAGGAVDLSNGNYYSHNSLVGKNFRKVEAKVVIE